MTISPKKWKIFFVEFSVYENDPSRTSGLVRFYNGQGDPIGANVPVSFNNSFSPEEIKFEIFNMGGAGTIGRMEVLFVELF